MKKDLLKRFLAVTMVSAMAVGSLAACGSGGDDSDGGKDDSGSGDVLKVAAFDGGNGADIWEKMTAGFGVE